jgi:Protein of unknown function (DUF1553)
MLEVSGQLDRAPGGEHPFPPENTWKFTQHKPFVDDYPTNKRTVYVMQQRIRKQRFLATFDGADTNAATGERPLSTTPLQALFMMNDDFAHAQACAFAKRVVAAGSDIPARLTAACRLAYARQPSPDEIAAAASHLDAARATLSQQGIAAEELEQKAWESLARVILSANEFVYVD